MNKQQQTPRNPLRRPNGRLPIGHRYHPYPRFTLSLRDRWGDWTVSFVDDTAGLQKWLSAYTRPTDILAFDCEWSDKQLGLIQIASTACVRQVCVIDALSENIDWRIVQTLFRTNTMVGFAIHNDKVMLATKGVSLCDSHVTHVIDIQAMDIPTGVGTACFKWRHMQKSTLGLDDYCMCVLGFSVKIHLPTWPNKRHKVRWGHEGYRFSNKEIHYAANDVIALVYMVDVFTAANSCM